MPERLISRYIVERPRPSCLAASAGGVFASINLIAASTFFISSGCRPGRFPFARAALEATAFQVRDVVAAMEADSGIRLATLKTDGGMVANELLMQFQAICWTSPWCGRRSRRPRPSAPPTPPASPSAIGAARTICGRTGGRTKPGPRQCRPRPAPPSTATGRRPCSGRSTGQTRASSRLLQNSCFYCH